MRTNYHCGILNRTALRCNIYLLDFLLLTLFSFSMFLTLITKEPEKPGKLANNLKGFKKKMKLDLPGLSPEVVSEWIKS